jgi:hypothetical protein
LERYSVSGGRFSKKERKELWNKKYIFEARFRVWRLLSKEERKEQFEQVVYIFFEAQFRVLQLLWKRERKKERTFD